MRKPYKRLFIPLFVIFSFTILNLDAWGNGYTFVLKKYFFLNGRQHGVGVVENEINGGVGGFHHLKGERDLVLLGTSTTWWFLCESLRSIGVNPGRDYFTNIFIRDIETYGSYVSIKVDCVWKSGHWSSYKILFDGSKARVTKLREKTLHVTKKIPPWYYKTDNFREDWGTVYQFLTTPPNEGGFTLPYGYKRNMFDCSEMAAYVEWALEDAGFEARICEGRVPWDPYNIYVRHAWVLVKEKPSLFSKDGWHPIEATALLNREDTLFQRFEKLLLDIAGEGGYVRSYCPYYENYFKYDYCWDSIYEIPDSRLDEYDWWNELLRRGGKVVIRVVP